MFEVGCKGIIEESFQKHLEERGWVKAKIVRRGTEDFDRKPDLNQKLDKHVLLNRYKIYP